MKKTRWAVVGTGYIAGRFAQGLLEVPGAGRAAVVSRREETARGFAEQYGFSSYYSDYKTMLQAEKPDVVYIATPNDTHLYYVMEALEAGVPVLCEKPMADNAEQLALMTEKAKEKGLFLMEGMWTRCFPAVRQARQWIEEGKIGPVQSVHASLSFRSDPSDWQLWKATLEHTGGALRDVGIYVLAMAFLGFPGEMPEKIYSSHRMNEEVDIHEDMMFRYSGGRVAFLSAGFDLEGEPSASIIGERGRIVLGPKFSCPSRLSLLDSAAPDKTLEFPYPATGFQFEVQRVQECLGQGLPECPDFTLEESRQICLIMDQLRKEWGIRFPADG